MKTIPWLRRTRRALGYVVAIVAIGLFIGVAAHGITAVIMIGIGLGLK